jgi:hypothetical protein
MQLCNTHLLIIMKMRWKNISSTTNDKQWPSERSYDSVVIKLQAHAVMNFIILKRNVVFIDSIPFLNSVVGF